MTSSYWFQGSAGPGPDVGDPVAQSLRFRKSPWLEQPTPGLGNRRTFTVSFWTKLGTRQGASSSYQLFQSGASTGDPISGMQWLPSPSWGDYLRVDSYAGGNQVNLHTDAAYRDPNAWYHIVYAVDTTRDNETDRLRIYVNGENQTLTGTYPSKDYQMEFNDQGAGKVFTIGANTTSNGTYEGYMAEFYSIDGQALLPTAFGRYNREGVWVPVKPDFSQTTAVKYSDYLTAPAATVTGATNAFDGLIATQATSSSSELIWSPPDGFDWTTSIEVYTTSGNVGDSSQEIRLDDVLVGTLGADAWTEVASGGGSFNTFSITNTVGVARISAIRIDGKIVFDPYLWSSQVNLYGQGSESGFGSSPALMFDGNLTTTCDAGASNQSIAWQVSTPITYNEKIEVFTPGPVNTQIIYLYSGGAPIVDGINNLSGEWTTVIEGSGTFDDLRIYGQSGQTARWAAVRIDGEVYVDGANPSFGNNGFYLDFSDPNDIGADRSGNDNNFTANNFDTYRKDPQWQTYAADWGTQYGTNRSPAMVFSGSATSTFEPGDWYSIEPGTIDFAGVWEEAGVVAGDELKVDVYPRLGTVTLTVNGTDSSTSGNDLRTITTTVPAGGLTSSTISGTDATYWMIGAMYVNGTMLVNGGGPTYDWMQDTPTQNYATLNPIDSHGLPSYSPILANANLASNTQTQSGLTGSTTHWSDENAEYYFEFTHVGSTPASTAPGLRTAQPGQPSSRTGANTFYYRADGRIVNGAALNAGGADLATGETWTTNDVIGTAYNPSNNRLRFFKNGAEQCDITISPSAPLQFGAYNDGVVGVTVNYGQQDGFRYQPDGTVALQTQNLPPAPIKDGGEHFRVLTGAGASILGAAQGQANGDNGTGFQRALWWIKNRETSSNNQLMDTVRGGNLALQSDTVDGESAYGAPGFNSVAWCWKAGESVVTNNTGSITSQASTNTTSGFSIVTYTGTGSQETVGHGLEQTPEFIIYKRYDGTAAWCVYHQDVGAGQRGTLNENLAFTSTSNFGSTEPTSSVFTIGAGPNDINTSGENVVAYCWHSVPGYSKVGSYVANGNTNGPVINCGFKPAFVMIKASSRTGDWVIYDAAKSTYNPLSNVLTPNTTSPESSAGTYEIDFLANGFKIRDSGVTLNGNSEDYIYLAIAQHPYGGPKIAPATAGFQGPVEYSGILPGIANSLRFRGEQNLRRTFGTPTNRNIWTLSFWAKRANLGTNTRNDLFDASADGLSDATLLEIFFHPNDQFVVGKSSSTNVSTSFYRDPSSWYHLMVVNDGTDILKYVNGVLIDTWSGQGGSTGMNNNKEHSIGDLNFNNQAINGFNGYMAEFYFIDAQALTPTTFGQYNDDNVWVPAEPTISSYGNNGFHLVFDPAYQSGTTLRDQSGNGNDWTMNGFQTSDYYSYDFDYMKDGPTSNYSTLNPLVTYEGQIGEFGGNRSTLVRGAADGNLTLSGLSAPGGGQKMGLSTQAARGKVYVELTRGTVINGGQGICLFVGDQPRQYQTYYGDPKFYTFNANGKVNQGNGSLNSTTEIAQYDTLSAGDVASIALDMDNGNAWFAKNGVWQQGDPEAGTNPTLTNLNADQDYAFVGISTGSTPDNPSINYGQQPFKYPVPVGYKSLNSQDLEAPITKGSDHFTPVLFPYTQQTISGLDFAPDLVWLKVRNNSWNWRLYDTSRGALQRLETNNTGTENGGGTDNDGLNSFTSDGFTHLGLGASGSDNYVAYCWKAGGAPVANNEGIPAQVSANTEAGFSIVTYTGNGGVGSVGHGLTKAPEFVIVKARTMERAWETYHVGVGASAAMFLNESAVTSTSAGYWNNQAPTETVIRLGGNPNEDGIDYVAYCWHSVPGFSAIGKFNGNSSVDGPFVHLGFRPAWIMFKATNNANPWQIVDTTRDTMNDGTSRVLQANADDQENTVILDYIDILSNGFKIRDGAGFNQNNWEISYVAFAENPLSISNAR